MTKIDLNAVRAARREKEGDPQPVEVNVGDVTVVLPAKLPLRTAMKLESTGDLEAALTDLVGAEEAAHVIDAMDVSDLEPFVEGVLNAYGSGEGNR